MFNLILAIDINRGIGYKGGLPWRIKKDMAFFKEITTSKNLFETEKKFHIQRDGSYSHIQPESSSSRNTVIMGKNTWESIPKKFKPLPERNNIILSRSTHPVDDDVQVYSSLEEPLSILKKNNCTSFIIGGNNVYAQCLKHPDCQRIYLTQIYHEFECDTFFEQLPNKFELVGSSNEENEGEIPFRFLVYENNEL